MANLNLSIAIGDYDRMRPLVDGLVKMDGVNPTFMLLEPEEIFFRAFRHVEFDICELSLSSYTIKTSQNDSPYVAVPVFPSRAFRHTSIFIRTDRRIKAPEDLKGKRIGEPEYQLTANVWAGMILDTEYGVHPRDITWVRGGYETPGRIEKIKLDLPPDIRIEAATSDATLSGMLADGRIDGIIGPRATSCFERGDPNVGWLFSEPYRGGRGVVSQNQNLSDHACAWHS
jgi:4,5-dihydroxyphthalate decarboxylase